MREAVVIGGRGSVVVMGWLCLGMALGIAGCRSNNAQMQPAATVNHAPVARAGADAVVDAGQSIILNAEGSRDPDGDALRYSWNIVSGTGAGISQHDRQRTRFLAAVPGTYIIELTARDSGNLVSSDVMLIEVRTR